MSPIDNAPEYGEDEESEKEVPFKEGDRVEWRKNGKPQRGIVKDVGHDYLIVIGDVPTGEPCPVLWGPFGIFSKVE